MDPRYDKVCVLLETPFRRWKENDKQQLLKEDRPTPALPINKKKRGSSKYGRGRSFQSSWYLLYPWLCGSFYLQKMFCWPCLIIGIKIGVWNTTGYDELTTVTRAFRKHEGSIEHLKNSLKFNELIKSVTLIAGTLKENSRLHIIECNKMVTLNRRFMELPIKAVLFLSKQKLTFRDHDERDNSLKGENFEELLNLLISEAPWEIQQLYLSIKNVFIGQAKTIQNELIECLYFHIHEFIKNEISASSFFSVEVDDITDISPKSQCSIIVRYVSSSGLVVERFLGFFDVGMSHTAEVLIQLLETVLGPLEYHTKLVAQSYDGASVMHGHLTGLQIKIKSQAPQALFIFCCAHRLDLVFKQSVNNISECRLFFANLSGIPSFLHHSAKKTYVLNSAIAQKILYCSDAQWHSNSKVLRVVTDEWKGLKEIFENILSDPNVDETWIRQAKGFLNYFYDFEFIFLSLIFSFIFDQTDILYEILQKQSLDINYCLQQVKVTRDIFSQKRNEDAFKQIFEIANSKIEIIFIREDDLQTHKDLCKKYKILYFEILDTIIMEFDVRFKDSECLYFFCLADSSNFVKFSINIPEIALESLKNSYPNVMTDIHRLKNELKLFYKDLSYRDSSVQEIIKKLHDDGTKDIFKEVYKLLCLILTIPAFSITSEGNISCLERIKNYLRNSTSEEQLTSLSTLSIEQGIINDLMKSTPFYDDVIDRFASLKEKRIDLTLKK